MQTISMDSQTLIVKSNDEKELSEIIGFINRRKKQKNIDDFLQFAAENRKIEKDFKFNRNECYGNISHIDGR